MKAEKDNTEASKRAAEFYHIISQLFYVPSTPTLFNAGTNRSQMSAIYWIARFECRFENCSIFQVAIIRFSLRRRLGILYGCVSITRISSTRSAAIV
ncbi:MAG: hypothetical protein EBU57_06560 [Alphaproteobacteria bacterium]|nr:hypothetical protein [Alphaproteobacteria bacterium]